MTSRWPAAAAAVAAAGVAVRVARSRHRRSLHPAGRSFAGELRTLGPEADRFPVTLRVSKAMGTRGDRPDVRGVAVRVHLPGRDLDLLLDSTGRHFRRLPLPRRSFDTPYSSITAYRTAYREKAYLLAEPDPDGPALGRTLGTIAPGSRLLLQLRRRGGLQTVGHVTLGRPLSAPEDAALAFDPVRNSLPGLHPSGWVHGARASAYRWSQRWRGAAPAPENRAGVARTRAHH